MKRIRLGIVAAALVFACVSEARLLRTHPLVSGRKQPLPTSRRVDPLQQAAPFPTMPASKAEHRVENLPGLDSSTKLEHYAGYIPVDEKNQGALFYWYFPRDATGSGAGVSDGDGPLTIWINGGPGCSSMFGLFMENGPLRASADGSRVTVNPLSWHTRTNLLFVDQPVGTGFSIVRDPAGYATDDGSYAREFVAFLESFLALYPEIAGRDLYLSGESYAGHYLPEIAKQVLEGGSAALRGMLKGVMIGNGWIDPETQYATYTDFAFGQGLVTAAVKRQMDVKYAKCYTDPTVSCDAILDDLINLSAGGRLFVNYYDVREYVEGVDDWPALTSPTRLYLHRADVLAAIHVAQYRPKAWEPCDDTVYVKLESTQGESLLSPIQEGLAAGVRFLFFAGQFDLICNHVGVGMLLRKLRWSGSVGYLNADTKTWIVGGAPAGYATATEDGALTNVMMIAGSHMVLGDRPQAGLDMLERFVAGKGFTDGSFALKPAESVDTCFYAGSGSDGSGGKNTGGSGKTDNGDNDDDDDDDDDDDEDDLVEGTLGNKEYAKMEAAAWRFRGGVMITLMLGMLCLITITVVVVRRARMAPAGPANRGALTSSDLRGHDPAEGVELTVHTME